MATPNIWKLSSAVSRALWSSSAPLVRGAVIRNLKPSAGEVEAAVYIAGFALERGESCVEASSLAPGSTLADTLLTVPLAVGAVDAYIAQE